MTTVTLETTKSHHKHRLANLTQTQVYKLLFAHLGKFMIVAWYYILLQTMRGQRTTVFNWHVTLPNVKYTWDHLLSATTSNGGFVHLMSQSAWTPMRHVVFRGLLEGVLGLMLYRQIGFNVQKYRAKLKEEPGTVDRLVLRTKVFASPYQGHAVTGVQYAFLPVLLLLVTIVLGVPLYLGVHYGLAHAAHWSWLEPHLSTHASFWQKLYVGDYDGLIIGLVVGFVAGRTYRAYLYDNAMYFGRTWVARGRREHWWMPKPTRDLVRDLRLQGAGASQLALQERSWGGRLLAFALPLLGLASAGFGFYVIAHIAK